MDRRGLSDAPFRGEYLVDRVTYKFFQTSCVATGPL
jgi:hypothetical protein